MINLYIFNNPCFGVTYGIGTYINELTRSLEKSNINICVVNIISNKQQVLIEETDGICYWHFPEPILTQWTTNDKEYIELYYHNLVYLLRLHIKETKKLIFHFNFPQYGNFVEKLRDAFECKIISVVHFSDWSTVVFDNLKYLRYILKNKRKDKQGEELKEIIKKEKLYYSTVDHIISLSDYMQEVLYKDYELDISKITVIPNGLTNMAEKTTNKEHLRKKWHLSLEEKIILFAGRIDEIKGVRFLIKAFFKILKIEPDCRLIIAGSGNYDLLFQESKAICAKITFTGLLEKNELYEFYQMADIGVIPSLFEPFGYVAVEMMMHKLPIVATATSGLNEVVDESCGLKIPIYASLNNVKLDTTLLAQKIVFLLQNPIAAKLLGQNGYKRYLEKYSSFVYRKKMIMFYNSLFH